MDSLEDCGWIVQLLDCLTGHYPEYFVALDSAFVVAFAADSVEVGPEVVVGLDEAEPAVAGPDTVIEPAVADPDIAVEPAVAGPDIVVEPAVAGPDNVAEPGNVAAVLALDTVAAALGIDVAVESDRDNVVVARADRFVAAALAPDIVATHGRLPVVVVPVADDTAGTVAGIAMETVEYNKRCIKKR